MGHFFDNFLVKDCLVEEDEGVAYDQTEKHPVENTHARVKKEENHSREHDNTSHHISLACL